MHLNFFPFCHKKNNIPKCHKKLWERFRDLSFAAMIYFSFFFVVIIFMRREKGVSCPGLPDGRIVGPKSWKTVLEQSDCPRDLRSNCPNLRRNLAGNQWSNQILLLSKTTKTVRMKSQIWPNGFKNVWQPCIKDTEACMVSSSPLLFLILILADRRATFSSGEKVQNTWQRAFVRQMHFKYLYFTPSC